MSNQNKPASFSIRLKEALRITGTKQIELSRLTKIDKGTINNYLWGKYEPKQDKLNIIADALDVSPVWLMGYDVPMEREKNTPEKLQLTEGEKMLLELFRQIPEEQQRVFLEMGRVYANSLKKD
jgi:transcriptional regulator with XRE-family HTH domain